MTTKLSDKTKRDLGKFFTTENDSFKDMDLYVNRDTKQLTQKALDIIEASPTLVSLLNDYPGTYEWGDPNEFGGGGGYNFEEKTMTIGRKKNDGVDYHTFVDVLIIIGHEAAHANGKYQHRRSEEKEYDFTDSREYSESYLRGEGEANYYEYKIINEFNSHNILNEYHEFDQNGSLVIREKKVSWEDQNLNRKVWIPEPYINSISSFGEDGLGEDYNYTQIMKDLIITGENGNKKDMFDKIGNIIGNVITIPRNIQGRELGFTYGDLNRIRFLHKKSSLYDDYYETVGSAPYLLEDTNADSSNKKVTSYYLKFTQLKTLISNSYGYDKNGNPIHTGMFGEGKNDIIFNDTNGTQLTSLFNDAFDLMYGGAGNDTLMGGNKKDIVLGGSDDDHLYGKGGADIIGGNKGNDHLYAAEDEKGMYKSAGGEELPDADKNILVGGEGNDHLYGGAGEDELFGDERLPEGEELKRESYESAGDDYLQGNAGNDNMYGGKGHDTYVVEDKDTIYDVDGGGEIWFVKESGKNISKEKIYGYQAKKFISDENNKNEEAWISADDSGNADNMLVAKRVFDDLVIKSKIRENDIAIIKDYFNNYSDGKLGITLGKKKEPPPTIRRNQMGLRP